MGTQTCRNSKIEDNQITVKAKVKAFALCVGMKIWLIHYSGGNPPKGKNIINYEIILIMKVLLWHM